MKISKLLLAFIGLLISPSFASAAMNIDVKAYHEERQAEKRERARQAEAIKKPLVQAPVKSGVESVKETVKEAEDRIPAAPQPEKPIPIGAQPDAMAVLAEDLVGVPVKEGIPQEVPNALPESIINAVNAIESPEEPQSL
jgi:hypothetical protein